MKTLIVAEKPSVARDIASALGGFEKRGDWLERADAIVTSGIGHLVRLDGPPWTGRGFEHLPAIPETFALKPISRTEAQLDLVCRLIARTDVTVVVNACDAGREGELIFRLIVAYARVSKPVRRMWLQSMTSGAIREAYRAMKSGATYDNLGAAARCRSEADWLVGINGSRGMTAMHEAMTGQRQLRTVGRVQTPTLGILVQREREIQGFTPQPFWEIHAVFGTQAGEYKARWRGHRAAAPSDEANGEVEAEGHRIWERERAEAILTKCRGAAPSSATDVSKRTREAPPLLFDLTTLQREANRKFKFSAKKTLDLTQALYEKHKAVTYPRTDSTALPEDYLPKAVRTVEMIAASNASGASNSAAYRSHAQRVLERAWVKADKRVFNNAKITDHFAIVPTGNMPLDLDANEAKVFDLIVRRFLAAFHPAAQYDSTLRTTVVAGELFVARGRVLVDPGWLVVYEQQPDEGDEQLALGPLAAGETPRTADMRIVSLQTKPPSRFTEATLLAAMETAGKLVDDEALRDALKERGLGTPATRAAIIETLLASKDGKGSTIDPYVVREGKQQHLVPTAKGIDLVQFLESQGLKALTLPAMTGDWEAKLLQVERGRASAAAFMAEIRTFTEQMVGTLKARAVEMAGATAEFGAPCPRCGDGLQVSAGRFQCRCGYELSRVVAGRKLSDAEARGLFLSGRTEVLSGFFSKAKNRTFSAALKLESEGRVSFDFPPRDAEPASADDERHLCPKCGRSLRLLSIPTGSFWGCTGYPECRHTQPDAGGRPAVRASAVAATLPRSEVNQLAARRGAAERRKTGDPCPTCGKGQLERRPGKQGGFFLGCSTFPTCHHFQWDSK